MPLDRMPVSRLAALAALALPLAGCMHWSAPMEQRVVSQPSSMGASAAMAGESRSGEDTSGQAEAGGGDGGGGGGGGGGAGGGGGGGDGGGGGGHH